MCDTFEERAAFWRERLQVCLEKENMSATKFINKYNGEFNDEKGINRNTFYRWRNVGMKSKSGKIIGFPKYENMLRIAQLFDVDVGYLTGETDEEIFTLEKVRDVLNLDAEAIKVIMKLTGAMEWGDTKKEAEIKKRFSWPYTGLDKFKMMFTLVITAEKFLDIMSGFVELEQIQDNRHIMKEEPVFSNDVRGTFKDSFTKVISKWLEADNNENFNELLWQRFEQSDLNWIQLLAFKPQEKIIKFNVMESLILLLNEIFPDND